MPDPVPADTRDRTRRVVAALVAGRSMREIAEAEGVTSRRIQQVISAALKQREANPATDFRLLQIARLEGAIETIGAEMDAGDMRSIQAYFMALDRLGKLGSQEFYLSQASFRRPGDAVALEDRFCRLDAAREFLAARRNRRRTGADRAAPPPTPAQALEKKRNREIGEIV